LASLTGHIKMSGKMAKIATAMHIKIINGTTPL
jgi:hypothetical protein